MGIALFAMSEIHMYMTHENSTIIKKKCFSCVNLKKLPLLGNNSCLGKKTYQYLL